MTYFTIRILTEREEAYYGYLAIIHSTSFQNAITIDIGSTEISLIHHRDFQHYHSFPFGTLTLTKEFLPVIPEKPEQLQALTRFIKQQFNDVPRLRQIRNVPVVGIWYRGGSANALAKIHKKQKTLVGGGSMGTAYLYINI